METEEGCWNLNPDLLAFKVIPPRFIPAWPSSNDGLVSFNKKHELLGKQKKSSSSPGEIIP